MRREFSKMSRHAIATLSEPEYTEFLRLKRRTLMRGKKSPIRLKDKKLNQEKQEKRKEKPSVHLTCNRPNRRRWTRSILRRYNILRKTIKEEQENETAQ